MSDERLIAQCEAYRGVIDDIRKLTGGKRASMIGAMCDAVLRENGPAKVDDIAVIRGRNVAKACAAFLHAWTYGRQIRGPTQRLEAALDEYLSLVLPSVVKDTSGREPLGDRQSPAP